MSEANLIEIGLGATLDSASKLQYIGCVGCVKMLECFLLLDTTPESDVDEVVMPRHGCQI